MRLDSIGLFWQDLPRAKGRSNVVRPMPPIPDTGWTTPTELPNLASARVLSFDVETYDPELLKHGPGWARGKGHIVGAAIGTDDGYRAYFPIKHTVEGEYNMEPANVLAWLRDTMGRSDQPKVGANITYDIGWLRHEGITVRGELHDVQFAEALLSEAAKVALDTLGKKYLGEHKTSDVLYQWLAAYYGGPETERQRKNIYRAPPRLAGPYAESDVDLPLRVLEKQWTLLHEQGLWDVYRMECDLIPLMIEMRYAGVSVDLDAAERLRDKLVEKRDAEIRQLELSVGFGVNVSASENLARVFDHYGLSYPRTQKGNPSFVASFLNNLDHPVGEAIRSIREKDKLVGTFLEGYILNAHVDGKVYGQFHQLRSDSGGARSGRFSSSDPNLQNIPVRSKLGKVIRTLFIPDAGHKRWRKHDYSQIEYRFLAHYAVGNLADHVRAMYVNDPSTDFHAMAQELIREQTGKTLERGSVKTINFGLVYGMGVASLSHRLKLSVKDGKLLFASYHEGAPFIKATMDATMNEAKQLGYITTVMGRRSRFDLWEPDSYDRDGDNWKALPFEQAVRKYPKIKRAYLHKALNRRLQGSAADLIKAAMLKCWQDGIFDVTGVPRLTVHDELDFSDTGEADDAFEAMLRTMETALPLRVPVSVGRELGTNWGTVEDLDS